MTKHGYGAVFCFCLRIPLICLHQVFFFFPFQNFDVVNFSNIFAKLVKFTVGNKKFPIVLVKERPKISEFFFPHLHLLAFSRSKFCSSVTPQTNSLGVIACLDWIQWVKFECPQKFIVIFSTAFK